MRAMWTFLNGPGYSVDLAALHAEAPDLAWTTYQDWAGQALNA
jgi:hypothetical protein